MCHGWGLAEHHVGLWSRSNLWSWSYQEEHHHGRVAGARQDVRQQHHLLLLCHLCLPLQLPDAQLVRGCHHGQLRLPHQRLLHPGSSSSGWIYQDLGGIWSKCWVSFKWRIFITFYSLSLCRGRIYYSEMYDMLKNMDPPLGFGSKCPDRLAFKKLIRMNQPIDDDGTVHFTTTLFSLIREVTTKKNDPSLE